MAQKVFKNIFAVVVLICAIGVMLKLGFWQLDRLEWKNDILAKVEAQENIDPNIVKLDLSKNIEFQRGYVEGHFLNKPAVKIKPRTNDKGEIGYHLLSPFKTNEGQIIIVNMGWYHGETHPIPTPKKLTGYLRTPDKASSFTPKNNPSDNQFYTINLNDLNQFYNLSLFDKILYLDSAFQTMQKPRNKHAQYAAFWFGMSGLLLGLTLLFLYKRKKSIKP